MNLRAALAIAGTIIFATGCSSRPADVKDEALQLSICEIKASGQQIIGTLVRASGTYESDSMTYSYFVDRKCGQEVEGIDLGSAWGVADYDRLRSEWTRACESQGSPHLCIVSQPVVFTGIIRKSTDGDFIVIDLESIRAE